MLGIPLRELTRVNSQPKMEDYLSVEYSSTSPANETLYY